MNKTELKEAIKQLTDTYRIKGDAFSWVGFEMQLFELIEQLEENK